MAKKNGKGDLHEDLMKMLTVQEKILDVQSRTLDAQMGLRGDVQELRGDVQELRGDVQDLKAGQTSMGDDIRKLTRMMIRRFGDEETPAVGDIVQVLDKPGEWLPAVVLDIGEEGTIDVEVFGIPEKRIRAGVRHGDQVGEWRWRPVEPATAATTSSR